MANKPGIVVTGASGRMGQMLIRAVQENEHADLVGAIEQSGNDWVGQDIGVAMGGRETGLIVSDDPLETFANAQAILDFTVPAASVEFAGIAAQTRAVHVIGTTGFSDDDITKINAAARHAVVVRAGNMSLGVNLLAKLVQQAAHALSDDFDIEIVETHHNQKIDAPSGTALMLGQAAAAGRDVGLSDV